MASLSNSESGSEYDERGRSEKGTRPSSGRALTSATDDLVSVTVRKTSPSQKAGVGLVERSKSVYITKITENGLFHESGIGVGDVVLSINGKRLKKGDGAKNIIRQITNSKSVVTMVVKKANQKARRGVRSLSPNTQRKKKFGRKLFRKAANRNQDGSLNYETNPRLAEQLENDPNDDKPQLPIEAKKLFPKQDIGVRLKDIDNMIFVCAIAVDSIFQDTDLELGDRIVSVNGMNFMSYGDAAYATKVIDKSQKDVALVVEKEHDTFDVKTDVDSKHETAWTTSSSHHETPKAPPSSPGKYGSVKSAKKNAIMSPGKYAADNEQSDNSDDDSGDNDLLKVLARGGYVSKKSNPPTKKTSKKKKGSKTNKKKRVTRTSSSKKKATKSVVPISDDGESSDESSIGDFVRDGVGIDATEDLTQSPGQLTKMNASFSSVTRQSLSKLNQSASLSKSMTFDFDRFDGDYLKVTIRKESESNPGFEFEKSEGKFLIKTVPSYERRIYAGMQVLAVNGVVNLYTVSKVQDIIKKTEQEIELIIDFSVPLESQRKCQICSRPVESHSNSNHKRPIDSSSSHRKPIDSSSSHRKPIDSSSSSHRSSSHRKSIEIDSSSAHKKSIDSSSSSQRKSIDSSSNHKKQTAVQSTNGTNGAKAGKKIVRRRFDEVSVSDSVEISIAESEITARIGNKAPAGQRIPRIPERKPKYLLGDFDSDTDENEEETESESDDDDDSDGSDEEESGDANNVDNSLKSPTRGSIARYKANDRFMIRVSKVGKDKKVGIEFFEHNGVINVSKVQKSGLFYSTPIMEGDKVLSINGKKIAILKTASNALAAVEERDTVNLFVQRPDLNDRNVKEALSQIA